MAFSRRNCKFCGKEFLSTQSRHSFCQRKCFLDFQSMARKKSGKMIFACQHCGKHSELDFDPEKDRQKWADLKCPFCRKPRIGKEDLVMVRVSSHPDSSN